MQGTSLQETMDQAAKINRSGLHYPIQEIAKEIVKGYKLNIISNYYQYVKLFVDNMRYKYETLKAINERFKKNEITAAEKKLQITKKNRNLNLLLKDVLSISVDESIKSTNRSDIEFYNEYKSTIFPNKQRYYTIYYHIYLLFYHYIYL